MSNGYFRDEASKQLPDAAKNYQLTKTATNIQGIPLPSLTSSLTVGPRGNILLQDTNLLKHLAHFDRERIPERVVHAKAAGAFGYFEVTDDITKYTRAKVFDGVGKKTPIAVRLSAANSESGSSDTTRNIRGFAVKFYTEEGVWDLAGNNTPILFVSDPMLYSSLIHSQKRNPVTHLPDPNMAWDFFTLLPQTIHQTMITFSDDGISDGYRYMHGFGSHTFKLVNKKSEAVYVKFHMRSDQGIKNLTPEDALKLQATDPDYANRDLYNAIERKDFPSWTFCIQVMTFEEAETFRWNPFDLTKVWPYEEYPLKRVGKLVLNRNPTNYFAQVEQIAFCPSSMPPGIEASPDKMLQARLFAYTDTQKHRLGANFTQLPVNNSTMAPVNTYNRDGYMVFKIPDVGPNYYPNSFGGPEVSRAGKESKFYLSGDVDRYNSEDDDNYSQPAILWEEGFDDAGRKRLVENLAQILQLTVKKIQDRAVDNFSKVNPDFGRMLKERLDELAAENTKTFLPQ